MSQVSLKQRLQDEIERVRNEWDTSRDLSARVLNQNQYVRLAFQQLDLDIERPEDQTLLLFALARAMHGGHPLKPARFLNTLILDAEAIVKKHSLTGGKREAVKQLHVYRAKYAKYSEHTLLQYMKDALNRDKNPYYDELAKGRPTHKLYSRTVFARPIIVEGDVNVASPPPRTKKVRERSPRYSKRITGRHPILKWLDGRVWIVVYESW